MKHLILSVFTALLFVQISFAQNNITEKNEKWIEGNKPCLSIDLGPTTVSNVEKALEQSMKDKGFKGTTKKGFLTYMQITYAAIAPGMMDVYFHVVKQDKDHVAVQMFLSKGYDNFMTGTNDKTAIDNAKTFLQNFTVDLKKYELNLAIEEQKEKIEKAGKENEKLQRNQKDMESERDELLSKIEQNKKDQDSKVKEIQNLNDVLSELTRKLNDLK